MFARKTTKVNVRMEDDMRDWEEFRLKQSERWRCQEGSGVVPDFMTSLQHFHLRQKRTTDPSLTHRLPELTGPFLTFQSIHSYSESLHRSSNALQTLPRPSVAGPFRPPDSSDN
jgi:hypothetical protein